MYTSELPKPLVEEIDERLLRIKREAAMISRYSYQTTFFKKRDITSIMSSLKLYSSIFKCNHSMAMKAAEPRFGVVSVWCTSCPLSVQIHSKWRSVIEKTPGLKVV